MGIVLFLEFLLLKLIFFFDFFFDVVFLGVGFVFFVKKRVFKYMYVVYMYYRGLVCFDFMIYVIMVYFLCIF